MCLLLEGNRSDQVELSNYATSSHFNDRKLEKTCYKAILRILTSSLREITRILGRNIFQPLRPPSPVKYHACLSSYAKLPKTNDSRKLPKTNFGPIFGHFWPFQGHFFSKIGLFVIFNRLQLDAKNPKNLMVGSVRTLFD